jgi:nucleoside-diphosphate-sugar epimerase
MTDTETPNRVFITGALGFIGQALANRYTALGVEVAGVDRRADPDRQVVAGDISEPGAWQKAAASADLVIHTAAIVSNAVGLKQQWNVNVLGTRRALDAAREAGAERFVHFSSVRAFSDRDYPDGVDEHWPVRTDGTPYVDTKVAGEQVVLQAHGAGEVACTVIRPADVYGPGSRPWTIEPVRAIKDGAFLLPAGGKGVFTPVYVDNLVDGVMLAASTPRAAGHVYTLGDGVAVTCEEFFGHYARMLGKRPPRTVPTTLGLALGHVAAAVNRLRRVESELNADTVRYLARSGSYSIEKARRELGYDPKVTLQEGMRRTEEWLRGEGLV